MVRRPICPRLRSVSGPDARPTARGTEPDARTKLESLNISNAHTTHAASNGHDVLPACCWKDDGQPGNVEPSLELHNSWIWTTTSRAAGQRHAVRRAVRCRVSPHPGLAGGVAHERRHDDQFVRLEHQPDV